MTQGEKGWRAGWITGLVVGGVACAYIDFIEAHCWWFLAAGAAGVLIALALDLRAARLTKGGAE